MTPEQMDNTAMRALVGSILRDPERHWTTMGFGMLRTYLDPDKEWRLNVWHDSLKVPGVSTIHDHPWTFTSWVLAGRFENTRFVMDGAGMGAKLFDYMEIKTGEGGGPTGEVKTCRLRAQPTEFYRATHRYTQAYDEIHETTYDGCAITLNRRTRVGSGEHAHVFWPHGDGWVDAIPRPATAEERELVLGEANEINDRPLAWQE